jgi:hypothetical protein
LVAAGLAVLGVTVLQDSDGAKKSPRAETTAEAKPAPDSGLLFNGDFETGDFSQWASVLEAKPGRASIVTAPRKEGSHAARLEARAGEFIGSDAQPPPGRNRTELVLSPAGKPYAPREGEDLWYRFSFYLPSKTPLPKAGTTQGMTILQWITDSPAGSAKFEQLGIFQFRDTKASGDPGPGHVEFLYTDSDSRTDNTEHFWRKAASAVTRDVWHEVLMHKRWSSKPNGYVEIWYDGQAQRLADGTTRMTMRTLTPGYSARMQHGIYRGNEIGGTAVIYLDGFRIGKTRAAVQQ